jgi:hypothetical protein
MCDNFLNSSNIIIDTEGNVFLIDICECHMTRSKKMHSIRTDILKPFVIRNLNKLNTLIQKKKKELFFTLNT